MAWRRYRNSDVMKIIIAPQGFKGNLTALEVSRAISRGIKQVTPDAVNVIVPMADGGEGTMQALVDAIGGNIISVEVTDPIGERITARWAMLSDGVTAVIEMAEASGLDLVPPEKRNPLLTTTYGTGELIRDALTRGCRKFIIECTQFSGGIQRRRFRQRCKPEQPAGLLFQLRQQHRYCRARR